MRAMPAAPAAALCFKHFHAVPTAEAPKLDAVSARGPDRRVRTGPDRSARYLLVLMVSATLAVGLQACGFGGTRSGSSAGASVARGRSSGPATANPVAQEKDRDNDGDHNDDDAGILEYGHVASASDQHISVALVTRYFAAAAAEDGRTACRLLAPAIAETVAEDEGHSPGLEGRTCPVVMSKLFKRDHRMLAEKKATLKVTRVRIEGSRALAVLEFSSIPETRQITERRVGNTWRIVDLVDGIIE
jgi:hypothetical protein